MQNNYMLLSKELFDNAYKIEELLLPVLKGGNRNR